MFGIKRAKTRDEKNHIAVVMRRLAFSLVAEGSEEKKLSFTKRVVNAAL